MKHHNKPCSTTESKNLSMYKIKDSLQKVNIHSLMSDVKSTDSTSNCVPKHRNCHDSFSAQDMWSTFCTAVQLALFQ
jgi:hypothetical protein